MLRERIAKIIYSPSRNYFEPDKETKTANSMLQADSILCAVLAELPKDGDCEIIGWIGEACGQCKNCTVNKFLAEIREILGVKG